MKQLITLLLMIACTGIVHAEDTNVIQAVQSDDNAAWESVFCETNQIPFYVNLYMRYGLYYEVMEAGTYDGKIYTSVFSDQRRLTGRVGLKLHTDMAGYDQSGTLPEANSGISVRRFRINTYGRGFFFSPITYGLEFGATDGKFYFNDGYLWFHDVKYVNSIKLGFFKAPMSLEALQSGSKTPMMEVAAPVAAFSAGYKLGLQLGGPSKNKRSTFYGGIFGDAADTASGDASTSYSRLIGRTTYLVSDGTDNDSPHLLHLGLSASHMYTSDGVQYRSRPESSQAPYMIDTGEISADQAFLYACEVAVQKGPVSFQSEFFQSFPQDDQDNDYQFWGTYLTAGLFLTGQSRHYNRSSGTFSGVKPHNSFSIKKRNWGAWELIGRYSYTDLTDGAIQGGIMNVISTGLNCYFSKNYQHRLMINGGWADIHDRPEDGNLLFIQTRLQLEF